MANYAENMIYRPARYSWEATSGPANEPLSLAAAKAHLRVDTSDDDDLVTGLVKAARVYAENYCRRVIPQQTCVLKLDGFPPLAEQIIELPGGKVQSITSIYYLAAADGASTAWDAANFDADLAHEPARVGLAYDVSWPSIREWGLPVTITYEAGYEADASSPADGAANIPEPVLHGMKLLIGAWYEHRESIITGVAAMDLPGLPAADALLAPYRVMGTFG